MLLNIPTFKTPCTQETMYELSVIDLILLHVLEGEYIENHSIGDMNIDIEHLKTLCLLWLRYISHMYAQIPNNHQPCRFVDYTGDTRK